MPITPLPFSDAEVATFIEAALAEDLGDGDVTSDAVIAPNAKARASMVAREPLVVAGLPFAEAAFRHLDADCGLTRKLEDGFRVEAGTVLLDIEGRARALLGAERTALNIVQHLSGIATLARRHVDAIAGTGAVILDTRKTIPLVRRLEKYACRCGGACNHRMGLFDAAMIKDNHIAVAGSVGAAIRAAKVAGCADIEVECDTLEQVREALEAGASSLLLDNMPRKTLRRAVALVAGRIPLEASGGVTLETVRSIAETGVDFISIGRLTQSAPAVDIGLDFRSLP